MKQLAYDFETSSLCVHTCKLMGIAISLLPNKAWYITFDENKERTTKILNLLKAYFEDAAIDKIGHNLKFDNQLLKRYGIDVKGRIHDTMVADYVLYPERSKHGLKLLSKLHLNYNQMKFEDIAIGKSKKDMTLVGVAPEIAKDYACEDVDQTLQLQELLFTQIQENKLQKVYDLDCQLVNTITSMEYTGVKIDSSKLKAIESDIEEQLQDILGSISKYTKGNFNVNSQKDLNRLLFDDLSLVTEEPKGKNGLRSVSGKKLKKLLPQHEVVKLIMNYKSLYKVKTTFIKALKGVNSRTNRLHTSINQTVAATGRLSSSGPNLQNIPSRTIGKRLRECFIASSDDHSLIGADYANIELRVMTVLSQDERMLNAYKNGGDLHTLTASKALGIDYDQVLKTERDVVGKLTNFGLMYGMTAQGLQQSFYLNADKEFSIEQCQSFINSYFELYQGVAKCREDLIYKATINGYTETMFGRKRHLPDINSNDTFKRESAKRLALNTPIQGTAADIIKMAMVNIDRRIKDEGLQSKMILQVHDELLFDVPNSEVKFMEKLVKHEMENAVAFPIALEVDLKTGKTWADVH